MGVGVRFDVHLKEPHWNNSEIIELSFIAAAGEYGNRTDLTVLGKPVSGTFSKNFYDITHGKRTTRATELEIVDEEDGSGSGDAEVEAEVVDEGTPFWVWVLVAAGSLILLIIPCCVMWKGVACLPRLCC